MGGKEEPQGRRWSAGGVRASGGALDRRIRSWTHTRPYIALRPHLYPCVVGESFAFSLFTFELIDLFIFRDFCFKAKPFPTNEIAYPLFNNPLTNPPQALIGATASSRLVTIHNPTPDILKIVTIHSKTKSWN